MATKATIEANALVIKNETTTGSNTANRVGQNLSDLAAKIRGYKRYVALLTQSGGAAPTAIILENDLGGVPAWTYDGFGGNYKATLTGAFTANKTAIFVNQTSSFPSESVSGTRTDVNSVNVRTDLGGSADGVLDNTEIEIRVYE